MSENLSQKQILLAISSAANGSDLRQARDAAHQWQEERGSEHLRMALRSKALNEVHDALINRAIELARAELMQVLGEPPCDYAFLLFGSGGRGEQTLWSDQDNGLIYGERTEVAEIYFRHLAERIASMLRTAGYPPCQGNVLATNAQWCKSIGSWFEMIDAWVAEPDWENVRYMLILADARCIYGQEALTVALLAYFREQVYWQPQLLAAMLRNTLHHKVAVGVFGQLIVERYGEDAGNFDVKYGAYIPMVNAIRLLAYVHGVHESSSLMRIDGLQRIGAIDGKTAGEWAEAFESALQLRAETPHQLEDGLYTTKGNLPLNRERRTQLKKLLRVGRQMQQSVSRDVEATREILNAGR